MESIKNWIVKHKYQTIGMAGITAAVIVACIVIVIIANKKEVPKETNNVEASVEMTTSIEPSVDGETTTDIEETTTKEQTTTTKETETTTKKQESATTIIPVYVPPTTQTPTTSEEQQTTKKPTPQPTTPQPTTTVAPVRGKNGVILEELHFVNKSDGVVNVPKNKTELMECMVARGYADDSIWAILYSSQNLVKQDLFENELKFQSTTVAQLKAIYGEPIYQYDYPSEYRYLVYQYGKYANGVEVQTIYIRFGFLKIDNVFKFGSVEIGNKYDFCLEEHIK